MTWEIERYDAPKKNTDEAIKELSIKLTAAEKEIERLTKQTHHDSYITENQKKVIENLKKTLGRYETENRAMRELLRQWI